MKSPLFASKKELAIQATPNFTVPLSDTTAGLPQVGGKGASLACLAAASQPVPHGFHTTTAAFRRFVTTVEIIEN